MNSYQMVLHRPVETAPLCGKFDLMLPRPTEISRSPGPSF
jgi:hypothetical protein